MIGETRDLAPTSEAVRWLRALVRIGRERQLEVEEPVDGLGAGPCEKHPGEAFDESWEVCPRCHGEAMAAQDRASDAMHDPDPDRPADDPPNDSAPE